MGQTGWVTPPMPAPGAVRLPVGTVGPGPAIQGAHAAGLTLLAGALGVAACWPELHHYPLAAVPWVLFGMGLVTAGAVLSGEPGENRRTGLLLVLCGLMWPASWTDSWPTGPWPLLTTLGGPIVFVFTIMVMSRYPDPRLITPTERLYLGLTLAWVVIGHVLIVLNGRPEWDGYPPTVTWPTLWPDPERFQRLETVVNSGEVLLAMAIIVMWLRRAWRLEGMQRRLALPVALAGMMTGLATAITQVPVALGATAEDLWGNYTIQALLLLAVPVTLVVSVVRGRLSAASVAQLVEDLAYGATPERVRQVLRRTLDDQALRIYFYDRKRDQYVDYRGQPCPQQPLRHRPRIGGRAPETRIVVPVRSSSGAPLALIDTRRPMAGQAGLVGSAVAASAIALENAQLQVELHAQLAEVQAAQVRVIEAAVRERHQMERDLHDGAQQRLLAVKMTLAAAEAAGPDSAELIRRARQQVGEALDELRDLARGLHPPLLSQAGLRPALTAMTESLPMQATVELPERRFPMATELTAYFVVSEALANIVKHAQARTVRVTGSQQGQTLLVEIADDGIGGADMGAGTGLTGLLDRVNAFGGTLRLTSPAGRGTTITVRIPCG